LEGDVKTGLEMALRNDCRIGDEDFDLVFDVDSGVVGDEDERFGEAAIEVAVDFSGTGDTEVLFRSGCRGTLSFLDDFLVFLDFLSLQVVFVDPLFKLSKEFDMDAGFFFFLILRPLLV
jgi:hypothetical protein